MHDDKLFRENFPVRTWLRCGGIVKWVESGQGTQGRVTGHYSHSPRLGQARGWMTHVRDGEGGGHRHYSIPLVVRSHSHSSLPTTLRDSPLFKPFITHLWFPMLASLLVTALWNAWFLNHVLDRINSFFNRFVLQLLYVVWKYITIKLIKNRLKSILVGFEMVSVNIGFPKRSYWNISGDILGMYWDINIMPPLNLLHIIFFMRDEKMFLVSF